MPLAPPATSLEHISGDERDRNRDAQGRLAKQGAGTASIGAPALSGVCVAPCGVRVGVGKAS